jgi:hypothetical protein
METLRGGPHRLGLHIRFGILWFPLCEVITVIEAEWGQILRTGIFPDHHCNQEEDDPHGIHHLESSLCEIVGDCGDEERQPKAGYRRSRTHSSNYSAIRSNKKDGQQCDSYPSQIQEDLNVTIVHLVQPHVDHRFQHYKPRPDPETLKARSE